MNHREIAKRVLRIATGTEPTEDQVDRLVDARKDGLRIWFVDVVALVSPTAPSIGASVGASVGGPFQTGDLVECVDVEFAPELVLFRRYTVSGRYNGGSKWIYLVGQGTNTWRASRFRLVSRPNTVDRLAMCGDAPSVQVITNPVALKEHWCCECRAVIPRGAKHELTKGLWDGKWSSFRTCFACCEVREELGLDCYTFGELFDECTAPEDGPTEHARRVLQRQQWRKERIQAERMERHWRDRRGVGLPVEVVQR